MMCVYLEREKKQDGHEGCLGEHVETHGALGRSRNTCSAAGVGASKPEVEM